MTASWTSKSCFEEALWFDAVYPAFV